MNSRPFASPFFVFVCLKEFLHLLPSELVLVLVVAGDGVLFVNSVVLLCQELLEAEHGVAGGSRRSTSQSLSWYPAIPHHRRGERNNNSGQEGSI